MKLITVGPRDTDNIEKVTGSKVKDQGQTAPAVEIL